MATLSNYTIRVQHTTLGSMPREWISNNWTTVYSAHTVITNTGWFSFCLTNVEFFAYNGTNNLLVDFSKSNEGWVDAGRAWFFRPGGNRTYEQYIDDSSDPLTWTGREPLRNDYSPPIRHRYVPHIQFIFSDDGDADGLPDEWELLYKPTLTNMSMISDVDDDGFPDGSEYRAGTNPTNAGSLLKCFDCATQSGSAPLVSWSSESNKLYRIERTASLSGEFTPVESNIVSTPPMNTYTDSTGAAETRLFYRIGLE